MKVDITDWDEDIAAMVKWLSATYGEAVVSKDTFGQMLSDKWRIYHTQSTVEGFYETTWWLEFDNEADGTAFLLRWS